MAHCSDFSFRADNMISNEGDFCCLKKDAQEDHDKILLQPYYYILQNPGAQFRTKLAKAFNHWLNVPDEKLATVGEIVQMLHNASLLIDDIEDNSKLRRGVPVAHSIFGTASTINAANYAYFLGLEKILSLNHPEALRVFTDQLLELHRGQGMEIYWRDNYICPTEAEYKKMVVRKTGGLFGLAIRMVQLFSDNKSDLTHLTATLGLIFQIRDDYRNIWSESYTENKGFFEDLTEGKFSFPIVHSIRTHPEDPQILSILRQRTTDIEIKKYCVRLLEKFGSFDYTKKILMELHREAEKEIEKLGGNQQLLAILEDMKE